MAPRIVPPIKRPRLMMAQSRTTKNATSATPATTTTTPTAASSNGTSQTRVLPVQTNNGTSPTTAPVVTSSSPSEQIKIYNNPDILICGNCREMFTELQDLLDHKKTYCKLRFTCKCNAINGVKSPSRRRDAAALLCVQCKDAFISAWDLMVHVQAAHMINIYELGVPKCANGIQHSSPSMSPIQKNGLEDDPTESNEIRLESPNLDKQRETNDLDQMIDTIDMEVSDVCGVNSLSLNHIDENNVADDDDIPSILEKPINGDALGSE